MNDVSKTNAALKIDVTFFNIFQKLSVMVLADVDAAVAEIMQASGGILPEAALDAVNNFQKLYSDDPEAEAQRKAVNDEVSDLFDQIEGEIKAGRDPSLIQVSQKKSEERLALAAVQKQLESFITLEGGIRDKLVPILKSVQFAELTKQRMSRMSQMWVSVFTKLQTNPADLKRSLEVDLARFASTPMEKEIFYKHIMKAPVPPDSGAEPEDDFLSQLL